jgi:hypothetical protein
MNRRVACGFAVLLLLGAAPPPLIVRLNTTDPANLIEARAQLDTDSIRLSGEARLTLTVEAPAPLSVTLPKPLVTTPNVWRIREDSLPLREKLPNGREKWVQTFHLSPLVPGEPKLALGPLNVRAGGSNDQAIAWDADRLPTVHVTTAIENPSADALRPPTDIEPVPPQPPVESQTHAWLFAIIPGLLGLSLVFLVIGRRKRPPAAPPDEAWAIRELSVPHLTIDRCAIVLREYLSYRFAIAAGYQTTPELIAALSAENRLPPDAVTDWRMLLEECDAARFSGTSTDVAGVADRAKALVEEAEKSLTTEAQSRRVRADQTIS